mmetsp:Transcript_124497/g.248319  ORF Transcript_124497/g.248319 Transcript_124497/m.248319 type:complete len:105 (-) Transcript_124497:1232-1546(-)|eukprot:CAMPEP_0172930528 /NCGR_PEP_ID=MMETSP1075-20121228/219035_1 /TAXON_ID=2916 /ORGANISM="Ceratium fusus, Strain PA161109" /LENGTH=104 /DNA_ID=CAMNT_0013791837 /DNA_START=126 /DNA_END=440 /DNA_ORIENTATION=+
MYERKSQPGPVRLQMPLGDRMLLALAAYCQVESSKVGKNQSAGAPEMLFLCEWLRWHGPPTQGAPNAFQVVSAMSPCHADVWSVELHVKANPPMLQLSLLTVNP